MKKNNYVQEFQVRVLAADTYQLKITRSDPDLDLSPLEFYLDTQQLIKLIDECRSALR
jgi:hypothetical protein